MNEKTRKNISAAGLLIAIGIVYGDIGTSPLYVMKSIVAGNGGIAHVNRFKEECPFFGILFLRYLDI